MLTEQEEKLVAQFCRDYLRIANDILRETKRAKKDYLIELQRTIGQRIQSLTNEDLADVISRFKSLDRP